MDTVCFNKTFYGFFSEISTNGKDFLIDSSPLSCNFAFITLLTLFTGLFYVITEDKLSPPIVLPESFKSEF